jgi:predicted alpha/beta hydrolase family esterase
MQPSHFDNPSLTGTNLIHYGDIWDERLQKAQESGRGPVAVLVCHGMGQQVRYETISSVAQAILVEAQKQRATIEPVQVHLCEANDDLMARAEVKWKKGGEEHEVHVYEAYWAPLTEGKVTYWDTIKFLVRAALSGLKHSRPFWRGSFRRWMFGGPKRMTIGPVTWIGLLVVLLCLLAQVGIVAYVSLSLAQQWKVAISQPLPTGVVSWIAWLAPFFPGIKTSSSWQSAATHFLVWFGLVAEAVFMRYFLIEFVGDVAAYVSPYKDSKFDEVHHQIRKIGLNVGKVIYGFSEKDATVPEYEHVVVVGHSLGSVLAYDSLNALINLDGVCSTGPRNVAKRTRALITFGSPLDKTAFMFRNQAKRSEDWIREQLAAAMQPLIVSYDYRPTTFKWVNIWSPMDIISGSLDYYDDPEPDPDDAPKPEQQVENLCDWAAWIPFAAHVQYWGNTMLREQLYRYVSQPRSEVDDVSAPYASKSQTA